MDNEEFQLTRSVAVVPIPQPDSNTKLYNLAKDYLDGEIQSPPHQRSADAWNDKKQREWIERCQKVSQSKAQPPLGAVCLYTLSSEKHKHQYLNEGLQRISSAAKALKYPEAFGLDRDSVVAALRSVCLVVQNRQYETHKEASADFVLVNRGTLLEPAEQHKHVLTYTEGWQLWEPALRQWREQVDISLSSFANRAERRAAKLGRARGFDHLFCVAHLGRPATYNGDSRLEETLRSCMDLDPQRIVPPLIRVMQSYVAEIETAWRAQFPDHAVLMQEGLARWCLGVMFMYKEQCRPDEWQQFFYRLFKKTKGTALFSYEDEAGKPKSIGLAKRLDCFGRVCEQLGLERKEKSKRDKRGALLKPGYHSDHILPFADYGEGQTQPLPARLNAAKAARTPLT